jgi:hypothetical protein
MPLESANIEWNADKSTKVTFVVLLPPNNLSNDIGTKAIMDLFSNSEFFQKELKNGIDINKIINAYFGSGRERFGKELFEDAFKIIYTIFKLNPNAEIK